MNKKINFFKKVITSLYDIRVFSNYAREGILKSVLYAAILTLILSIMKGIFIEIKINNFGIISFISLISANFLVSFSNLLIDCFIIEVFASFIAIFMRMIVKYRALYSLTIYASTLPLITQTIFETINYKMSFEIMFIIGTLTYVILILKYIKDDIISNINSKNTGN